MSNLRRLAGLVVLALVVMVFSLGEAQAQMVQVSGQLKNPNTGTYWPENTISINVESTSTLQTAGSGPNNELNGKFSVPVNVSSMGTQFNITFTVNATGVPYGYSNNPVTLNAPITAASWNSGNGGVVTFTVPSSKFAAGQTVTISGMTPAGYNGQFLITGFNSSTFQLTAALATNPGPATVFGTTGNLNLGLVYIPPQTVASSTPSHIPQYYCYTPQYYCYTPQYYCYTPQYYCYTPQCYCPPCSPCWGGFCGRRCR